MAADEELPLVVIVGPTASGKTAAAIELAKLYSGEIIAADSRTVYQDMNIGTAKPNAKEQAGIVHWGFDLVQPGQRFSAAQFKTYANQKIIEIRQRGHLPIMVGGTGLYIDAVIFDYQFPKKPTTAELDRFESMDTNQLYKYCVDNNIELPISDKNKRHLVQAILRKGQKPKMRSKPGANMLVVGITTDKQILNQRFVKRAEHMFDDGVVQEATMLGEKYGWDSEAMTGNIYPLIREYLAGSVSLDETILGFVARDRQLAKRQMTWFRRNPWIVWSKSDEVVSFLVQSLDECAHL